MGTKSLDELYEVLKERRRLGKPQGDPQATPLVEESLIPESVANSLRSLVQVGEPFISGVPPADLIRVLEIKTLANRVFESAERADAWLRRPNRALSLQRPVDLLQDELGAAVVREMLEQIDHGIFA